MRMFRHQPGFRVVLTSLDGINGRSIQTLLRGENDLKQSEEIQAIVVLEFDDSCYVDARQHHLASFPTRNSTLNTSLR